MHGSLNPQPLQHLPEQRPLNLVIGSLEVRKAQVQGALGTLVVVMTCCKLNAW